MTIRNMQCAHCGHPYEDKGFFSEDYADYYSRKPLFTLTWCYNCAHVTVLKKPWYTFFIPILKPYQFFDMNTFRTSPYSTIENPDMQYISATHLMRMIWNCLVKRAQLKTGKEENYEYAMSLLLGKFSPDIAAIVILTAENAPFLSSPEQQLMEGAYYRKSFIRHSFTEGADEFFHEKTKGLFYRNHFTIEDIEEWTKNSSQAEAKEMMKHIKEIKSQER